MNPHRFYRPLINRFRAAIALSLLAAGLAVSGCAHGPDFTDEGLPAIQPLAVNSFGQQWSALLPTSNGPITHLYLRDKYLFAYTDSGVSYVLDQASGEILHNEDVRHGESALHPPVVLKDYIIYPTNSSFEIYDKKGEHISSKDVRFSIRSNAVGSKTFVYVGADFVDGGRLVAVDITNLYVDHRWELMFPGAGISSGPALLGDIVYAASENGDVAAIAYDTREPIWTTDRGVFHTFGAIVADLVADETGVYVASTDDKLVALNRNNGHVKWQYNGNAPLRQTPVVTKDFVFVQVPNLGLVALDKLAGPYNRLPKWVAPDATQMLSEDDKYVYLLRNDNLIVAVDKPAGRVMFTSKRHDLTVYTPNPKDGTIYTVTSGNRVLAIVPVLKPGQVGEVAMGATSPNSVVVATAK